MAARVSSAPIFPKGQLVHLVWHLEQHLKQDSLKMLASPKIIIGMKAVLNPKSFLDMTCTYCTGKIQLHCMPRCTLCPAPQSCTALKILNDRAKSKVGIETGTGSIEEHTIGSSQGEDVLQALLEAHSPTPHEWLHFLWDLLPLLADQNTDGGFSCPTRPPNLQGKVGVMTM